MLDGETPWRRLIVIGSVLAALSVASATAGATVVPALAEPSPSRPYDPPPAVITGPSEPTSAPTPTPSATPEPTVSPTPSGPARQAATFAGWASPLSGPLNIPQTVLESYGYAEWVLQQTRPACKLQWTTLAAIGKVATDHARLGGASVDPQGRVRPALIGPALKVADTDGGALDGDQTWDHAVGPMQFLPSMWRVSGVDADDNKLADPQDVDDAALSAGYHLCAGGLDLSVAANWKSAITAYHGLGPQIEKIFEAAQDYGVRSRS